MNNLRLKSVVVLFFSALLTYSAYAENQVDRSEPWRVFKTPDHEIVFVDQHGLITYEDRMKYAFFSGKCDQVFNYFRVYTIPQNNDFANLQDHLLSVRMTSNNNIVNQLSTVLVFTTDPFLMGYLAELSLGWQPLDDVLRDFQFVDELTIEIVDHAYDEIVRGFNITDYFDIPKNTWNFDGFEQAILEGQRQCYEISEKSIG